LVDVVRINFSHGTAEEHLARIARVRELSQGLDRPIAVLGDLPGPKLRALLDWALELSVNQEVAVAARPGPDAPVGVTEPEVLAEWRPEQRVLLDDGRLQLRVVRTERSRVVLRVEVGGTLLPNKGVNLPDTLLSMPAVTPRDRQALEVAARA